VELKEILVAVFLDLEISQIPDIYNQAILKYDAGYGDYTKEKYGLPDMSIEEIDDALKSI